MPLLNLFTTRALLIELIVNHCEASPSDFQLIPNFILAIALNADQPLHDPLPLYQLNLINEFMISVGYGVYPELLEPRDI